MRLATLAGLPAYTGLTRLLKRPGVPVRRRISARVSELATAINFDGPVFLVSSTVWLRPKQAGEYAKCDVATLRRAVKRGALRALRVNGGRRVRFRAADIDQ